MGIDEEINDKRNLPQILENVASAFRRVGTDDFEDELDKNNTGMCLEYKVS